MPIVLIGKNNFYLYLTNYFFIAMFLYLTCPLDCSKKNSLLLFSLLFFLFYSFLNFSSFSSFLNNFYIVLFYFIYIIVIVDKL